MKRKLALFLSLCLFFVGLTGCVTVRVMENKSNSDSLSKQTSEPVTEEPTQALIEVTTQAPTEAPTEAPTQPPTQAPTQVPTTQPPVIQQPAQSTQIDKETQKKANYFLSNFSEQFFDNFSASSYREVDLLDFVYLYCKINHYELVSSAQVDSFAYSSAYCISKATVDKYTNRFFNIQINPSEGNTYWDGMNEEYYWLYQNGTYYIPAADGESYNDFSVVKSITPLGDGTYQMEYVVFNLDLDIYFDVGMPAKLYSYSISQAYADSDLSYRYEGTAVARPYQKNGIDSYQLISYN